LLSGLTFSLGFSIAEGREWSCFDIMTTFNVNSERLD
jgi:hypothetical protein